jgi:glycosyltransferase involved in cell wall biosynthesis
MSDKPLVSVVVPTFNSERFLEKCLASVRAQSYGNIEVIVVDNYSKDKTREIAEKYGARVILRSAGMSRARNVGADLARGKFIFSVDSDMELTPNVVTECVEKVEKGFDAVIIPEVSVGEGFWAKCRALEKECYIGDDLIEAARFFKREIFKKVGGYDGELVFGEDWDLNQRIRKAGYRIGRVKSFIRHNQGKLRLWKAVKKKYQYGKTFWKYKRKHSNEAKQQLSLIRPAFMKHWRKLAGNPTCALGMLFMKACEFGAGLLGALAGRMRK